MSQKIFLCATILFFSISGFAQQLDRSLVPYRSGDKWGYATPENKIVISPKYQGAEWFSEGIAAVKIGSKYGYINKAGKLIIPARFTIANPFKRGYLPKANSDGGDSVLFAGAALTADGYEKCIDTKGRIMPKCPAINENSTAENNVALQTVVKQKTYSLPNSNGLFDEITDDYTIQGESGHYYIAKKNGLFGVFNSTFDTIVPFKFTEIKKIISGGNIYLQVTQNNMQGILAANGKEVIAPDNSNLVLIKGAHKTDYIIVRHNGKSYVKDLNNNAFIATGYSDINYDNNGGFVITSDDNNKGFYFMDGTTILPKYSDVHLVKGGEYLLVKTFDGKLGYVNKTGTEFFTQ